MFLPIVDGGMSDKQGLVGLQVVACGLPNTCVLWSKPWPAVSRAVPRDKHHPPPRRVRKRTRVLCTHTRSQNSCRSENIRPTTPLVCTLTSRYIIDPTAYHAAMRQTMHLPRRGTRARPTPTILHLDWEPSVLLSRRSCRGTSARGASKQPRCPLDVIRFRLPAKIFLGNLKMIHERYNVPHSRIRGWECFVHFSKFRARSHENQHGARPLNGLKTTRWHRQTYNSPKRSRSTSLIAIRG